MKYCRVFLAIALPVSLLFLFITTLQIQASPTATFVINSTLDAIDANPGDGVCETAVGNGVCTLRAAVMETNSLNGSDIISLPANTYALTISGQDEDASATGDIDILDDLTIVGANANTTIVDGSSLDRIFHITGTNDLTVSISNLTIRNGGFDLNSTATNSQGGGIFNALAGATLLITDTIVLNNQSFTDGTGMTGGGGIYNVGSLHLSNTDILTNSSPSGHGVLNEGNATITGGNFAFNSTVVGGGGTLLNLGTLFVESSHFFRNYSYGGAGINNAASGIATLENVSIYSNTVYLDGGGILNIGTITVTDSAIYGNQNSTSPGGGISNRGTFHLINSKVHHNTALGFAIGGGISIYDGVMDIDNSEVYSNSAGVGGGIYLKEGELLINNTVISGNVANTMGGGIYTFKPLSIENSSIFGNEAQEGGGIYLDGAVLTITTSTIQNNQANEAAGIGLYNTSQASLQDSTIAYNSTITEGGGLFIDSASSTVITDSTINHNSAATGGGILNYGQVDATNTTISNNSASSQGGGIWHQGSGANDVTLTNVTVVENSAPSGSGIHHLSTSSIAVTNTLIANNGVENCNLALSSTYFSLEDSDECGLSNTGDIINTNPLLGPLTDNGGANLTHVLLEGSPAIDAGDNVHCPATDQRGGTRPFDGDDDGTVVCDIGAVEYGAISLQYIYLPQIMKP